MDRDDLQVSAGRRFDPQQLEAFLAVAAVLHFGRAAARLGLSQSRVSRLVAALERRIGGALFERTSRQVTLTALGRQVLADVGPAYARLNDLLVEFQRGTRRTEELRIGYHTFTADGVFAQGMREFAFRFPECSVTVVEVPLSDPYEPLRRGAVDLLVTWRPPEQVHGVTVAARIDEQARMLAVAGHHRFAERAEIFTDEVVDWPIPRMETGLNSTLRRAIVPVVTPSGRELDRAVSTVGFQHTALLVSTARAVHITVAGFGVRAVGHAVNLVPIADLPPVERVLLRRCTDTNPLVEAFGAIVAGNASSDAQEGLVQLRR
ncbi:LysR family transcriptional regulator [Nocardia sp. NPDC052278]|uniref:LysR family transcriptional regulator n=1 Tax=unclassified Nocardia TaxID=2637762 RepID=UPI003680BA75